jgi:hypothetical protein
METTIRKVLVPRFGDESVLQVIEATIASPQTGEVQVLHSVVAGTQRPTLEESVVTSALSQLPPNRWWYIWGYPADKTSYPISHQLLT